MSVFTQGKKYNRNSLMFLDPDGSVSIARYDMLKYKVFDRLLRQQRGYAWVPEEIELSRDKVDFKSLSDTERHIFTMNIKRQIILDSVQGRAPALCFAPFCSIPELESWLFKWTESESVHSDSYTHIIRGAYADPSKVFDDIMEDTEIMKCAADISKYYDALFECINNKNISQYEVKKRIWLAMNAVNALEGIRFYVSFACSWAFAEQKKMQGNAAIITLIARDENLHLAGTQTIIRLLSKDDPDFAKIKVECESEVYQIFKDVIGQEKDWAGYVCKDGSMLGLSVAGLCKYVDYIGSSRMRSIGLTPFVTIQDNPFPWTIQYINSKSNQPTPQQQDLTAYTSGDLVQDLKEDTFSGFEL